MNFLVHFIFSLKLNETEALNFSRVSQSVILLKVASPKLTRRKGLKFTPHSSLEKRSLEKMKIREISAENTIFS